MATYVHLVSMHDLVPLALSINLPSFDSQLDDLSAFGLRMLRLRC